MQAEKVTSLARIKANRENAKKSTGPKDTSLTRLNALKHGLLSKEVLFKGESKKQLEEYGRRLLAELAPAGELELTLVDRIISSVWRLKRAIKIEREYIQAEYEDCKFDDFHGIPRDSSYSWNIVVSRELGNRGTWLNLLRYETAIERQIYRALHELMRIQSARRGQKPIIPLAIDVDITQES